MKLRSCFTIQEIGGEQYMVATGKNNFGGLVRSNRTAAFIVDCLRQNTSREEILDKMAACFDAPRDIMSADLDEILSKLRSINALEE